MANVPNSTNIPPTNPALKRRSRDELSAAEQPQSQPYKRATTAEHQVNSARGGPRRDTTQMFERAQTDVAGPGGEWGGDLSHVGAPQVSDGAMMGRAIVQPGPRQGGRAQVVDGMGETHGAGRAQDASAQAPPTQGRPGQGHPTQTPPAHAFPTQAFHNYAGQYPYAGQSGLGAGGQLPVVAQPAPYVAGSPLHTTAQDAYAATLSQLSGTSTPTANDVRHSAPHRGVKSGQQTPSDQAHQMYPHNAATSDHGGAQAQSLQPPTAQQQQAPSAPLNQTPSIDYGKILRGTEIHPLPISLSPSLHALLSKIISRLLNPWDATKLSKERVLLTQGYVTTTPRNPGKLKCSIVPGIPQGFRRNSNDRPVALQPRDIFELRNLVTPDQRLTAHLEFVALGLIMQGAEPNSVIYWGAWNVLRLRTHQLLIREDQFYTDFFPKFDGTDADLGLQQKWTKGVYEQSLSVRFNAQTKLFEKVLVGDAAGAKRPAQPEDEVDTTNTQKKVREQGDFTLAQDQVAPPDQAPLVVPYAAMANTQEWSSLQDPSENLVFPTPFQHEQPGGHPLPSPVDGSSEADLVKMLRQHLGQMSEEIFLGPAPPRSVDLRQQLPRGPIMSFPGARPSPSQEQALIAPAPSRGYSPSSAHYLQSNYIDLTGSTDVGDGTKTGQVPATSKAQSSSPPAVKNKSMPNTKSRSGSMFKPEDDPWFEQNGIPAWKIEYPGDIPKLRREDPPYTSYEFYPKNSKGLYRCLCETSPWCKSCETGISASDLRKRVDKRLQTWRRKIEKMIQERKLDPKHKIWPKSFLKPASAAEEKARDKEEAQLRKAEQQQADANLTVNQPLVSGDLFAGAAGYRDQQPSSKSTVRPLS